VRAAGLAAHPRGAGLPARVNGAGHRVSVISGLLATVFVVWSASEGRLLGRQTASLEITSPRADTVVLGATHLSAAMPDSVRAERVSFFVDGRLVCEPQQPPYGCTWDAGSAVREHHVRVVAYLADGQRLVANMRTKDVGYTERVDVDAIQVPVVVTEGGKFVRGLRQADFSVMEDGVPQRIASLVSEEVPLDLVLAIDTSGSMEGSMDAVKRAVKQLLTKLRPGDAATLVGFNETTFLLAERETDPRAREDAVDLLTPWGGTALYDATITALELVRRQPGRKGVVIFSDGDDRDSLSRRETAMARVQASDAMLFTVAFGRGGSVPALREGLQTYARASGGRAFFAQDARDLDRVFGDILDELTNQYVLSYAPVAARRDGTWHALKVTVRNSKYHVRAREGYRALRAPQARR
jgi:Ca-activated chloride channel homolog